MIINHFCGISRTTLGNTVHLHLVLSHHLTLSYPPTLLDDNSALQPLSEQQQNGRGREQPTTNHWMPPLLHLPETRGSPCFPFPCPYYQIHAVPCLFS